MATYAVRSSYTRRCVDYATVEFDGTLEEFQAWLKTSEAREESGNFVWFRESESEEEAPSWTGEDAEKWLRTVPERLEDAKRRLYKTAQAPGQVFDHEAQDFRAETSREVRAQNAFTNTLARVLKRVREAPPQCGELGEQSWVAGLKYADSLLRAYGEVCEPPELTEQDEELLKSLRDLADAVATLHGAEVEGKSGRKHFETVLDWVETQLCAPADSDYYLTAPEQPE